MNSPRFACGWWLCGVLALALALRVGACAWWQSRLPAGANFAFGDSDTYWTLARELAAGRAFQYGSPDARVFRTPGYPLLLAPLFLINDQPSVMWGRWLSAVCGTLAVAGVYALAARLFDRHTALLAAALAAVYPGAIAMSVVVLSEAPFCPLVAAQLATWVASWRTLRGNRCPPATHGGQCPPYASESSALTPSGEWRSLLWAAASGGLGGLATLMRPSWLLFIPFAVLAGLVLSDRRRRMLSGGLVMLAALVAVMLPWWVRNARVVGHFVPTTLQVGASLYDGLNPRADGSSRMDFVAPFEQIERREDAASDEPFEYRLDRRLRQAALDWAAGHPKKVARLAVVKFIRLWNLWPNDPRQRGGLMRWVSAAAYLPMLVLALVGIWRTHGRWWPAAVCWLPAVYLTLLHVVFVSSIRYREPAMLGLIVLAASVFSKRTKECPRSTAS
ncbi:MAG TPA: glycosyltransferase family 39 protein [Pirellulales bacterium]